MRYAKLVDSDNVIRYFGCFLNGGIEISKDEYNQILMTIQEKPIAPKGKDYRLMDDLTWELYDLPPMEEYELTDEELGRMVREGMM